MADDAATRKARQRQRDRAAGLVEILVKVPNTSTAKSEIRDMSARLCWQNQVGRVQEETMSNDLIDPNSNLPVVESDKPAIDADRELIKELAMDIGKEVVTHIETMYPAMFEAVAGTAKLSVRNTVYNEIMAALEVNDADAIRDRLEARRKFRRKILKAYRDIRKPTDEPG